MGAQDLRSIAGLALGLLGTRHAPHRVMLLHKLLNRDVVTVSPDASLLEAARLMRAEHVGDVVAVGPDRRPIGILTDRDIVVSVLAKDVEHLGMLAVKDVLTHEPLVAGEHDDVQTVLARMKKRGVRRVPVVDLEGALVGVFALDDVLGLLADDLGAIVSLIARQHRHEEIRRP